MKKIILVSCLAVLLATSSSIPFINNNIVYAFSTNPIEDIGISIGIDDEEISIENHSTEQIAEKTIKGVWKAANTQATVTFSPKGPSSVLKVAANVLETLLPLIADACEGYSIEHGGQIEYLNYISPDFDNNKFDIIAYDPYSTEGRYIGDIESTNTDTIFRVKIYPEFSANNPVEYSLKNLEKITIPSKATMENLVLEFYTPDNDTPFERVLLSANKDNKNYGICLTKTNSENYTYYLTKETDRKFNTFMVDKILAPLYTNNGHLWNNQVEELWDGFTQDEREDYGPLILEHAKVVDKTAINRLTINEDYALCLWQDPKWLLRGNTMFIFGNNYYSNFSENTEKILVNDNGEEKPNLGLHFNENGKASYQIYIPKTGTYELSYIFKHSDPVNFTVKNLYDGEVVYSMEADGTEDGQPHVKVSVPREIDIDHGVLNIEVEGSNFDYKCMILRYIGNKEEERAKYLQTAYDSISSYVANAIDLMDRKTASQEEIEYAINSANYVKENMILVKKQSLLDAGYSPDESLMQDIDVKIQDLDNRIEQAYSQLESYGNDIILVIEGEDPYENLTSMRIDQGGGVGVFTSEDFDNGRFTVARYKVTIPESGYYIPNYFIANFNDYSLINVVDENGRTFDSLYVPNTCDIWTWEVEKMEGTREYFEAGDTYIGVCCTRNSFMLDKIQLVYDENQE
ncbi:hypothetical protein [Vallitalea guaymasensis]|uniref:Uncharacterized protein n=1 Tax=Vallitalea guaymasensis TaxID=1185412 RepID=A0A8J8M896_9FIRM|nr:hypothetical protein [Vallitalea guaymasensis]QUH28109.1 hypothetical protein HYG85_03935 [Vallitalea guaymasensis]